MKVLIWLTVALISTRVFAALGESEDSCEHDRALLNGIRSVSQLQSYRIHTIQAGATAVKEYVANNGQIFAVTWRGSAHPNLAVLLGAHYAEFKTITSHNIPTHGRAPNGIKTSHAIVMRGGHMRDVHGEAYIPEAMPEGLKIGELL